MAKSWEKKADDEWSRVIREVGECEMCGRQGKRGKKQGWTNLDSHHIIFRTYKEYRHDLSNGLCLCTHCHQWGAMSPHQNKDVFFKWLAVNRQGQSIWYGSNIVVEQKEIGGLVVDIPKPICRKREETYRESYERLKEIKKG